MTQSASMLKKFVARQPIFDRRQNVYGYELLFRSGLENYFSCDQPDRASSSVVADSFLLFGLETMTGGKKAFLNFTRNLLIQGLATLLPPEQAVIEVLENVEVDKDVVARCRFLKQKGYLIALDDFSYRDTPKALVDLADFIKVDFLNTSTEDRKFVAEHFARTRARLVAEKVETREQFREAVELGYSYFQGYFFCRPETFSSRDIPAFKINYLQLLQAINKPEPSFFEIERIIKREASLCYKLLRYLNSALFGFPETITSLRHAVALLGLNEMRKWVSLLALAAMGEDKPPLLIITSVIRARFCESLALNLGQRKKALDFFLMGLFSLMDVILERPMGSILEEVYVPSDVKNVLLGEQDGLRNVYDFAIAYEKGDWDSASRLAAELRANETVAADSYLNAVKLVHEVFDSKMVTRVTPR